MFEVNKRYDGYRLNHPDFADVQKTVYKTGKVEAYDIREDTCTVKNFGTLPVFYHCGEFVEARESGALKYGSTSMWETESGTDPPNVIVAVVEGTPVCVIGFADYVPRHCCWEPFELSEVSAFNDWKTERTGKQEYSSIKMKQEGNFWRLNTLIDIPCLCQGDGDPSIRHEIIVTATCTNPLRPGTEDPILGNSTMIYEWFLDEAYGNEELKDGLCVSIKIETESDPEGKEFILIKGTTPGEYSMLVIPDQKTELELNLGEVPITKIELSFTLTNQVWCCFEGEERNCLCCDPTLHWSYSVPATLDTGFKYLCFRQKLESQDG